MYKKENFPVYHIATQIGTGYLLMTTETLYPFKDGPFKYVSITPVKLGERLNPGWYHTCIDGIGIKECTLIEVTEVCTPLKPGVYPYYADVWNNPKSIENIDVAAIEAAASGNQIFE